MSEVLINPQRSLRVKPLNAEEVVSAVERALLTEVRLTPKPGLVDIRNAGAHHDMDWPRLRPVPRGGAVDGEIFHHGPRYRGDRAGTGVNDAASSGNGL